MVTGILLYGILLPSLVASSGEGNLHLLEDEIAVALQSCVTTDSGKETSRQQRSTYQYDGQYGEASPHIDGNSQQNVNQYSHERRNTSDLRDQMHVLNATDYDYDGYGGNGERLVNSLPRPVYNRTRRNDALISKSDSNQCLSQCVFANIQVVDVRGIPRETELWNRIQASVTSQQSRVALRDQLRVCFEELQSEAEDDGCSYSNKLERCLMLRFTDRKPAQGLQKNS